MSGFKNWQVLIQENKQINALTDMVQGLQKKSFYLRPIIHQILKK